MSGAVLDRHFSRLVDRRAVEEYGMSSLVLMENAGRGVADRLQAAGISGTVAICCGGGNNGGDGLVLARHLDLRGVAVKVLLLADPGGLKGDPAANYRPLSRSGVAISVYGKQFEPAQMEAELAGAEWVVDALLGTGARGEPRPPFDAVIDLLNRLPARRLAVDVPSGLDCDTGVAAEHTFKADLTCSFVTAKPGFFLADGPAHVGQRHICDIGAPRKLVEAVVSEAASAGSR